jgi:hypothetical protein
MRSSDEKGGSDLNDEAMIRDTHARFCQYLDERRFVEWSELFAPEGTFQGIRTRDEILAAIERGGLARRPELLRKHITANFIIGLDGDRADVESDLILYEREGEGEFLIRTGKYTDRMVREGERWLFENRDLEWTANALGDEG